MKRLLFAALGLLLAGQALALESLPTSNKVRTRRVCVVADDNQFTFSASAQANQSQALDRSVGGLYTKLTAQGAQVDFLNTSFFLKASNLTNSEATLWKNLGNTYALVIVHGAVALGTKTAGATNTVRFYRADSTNAQLLLIYGGGNRKEMSGGDSTFAQVNSGCTNSTTVNATGSGVPSYGSRQALAPYGSTDTLYGSWYANGIMAVTVDASISSVVRILQPLTLTAGLHPFGSQTDSAVTVMPAYGDSTASSTAGAQELLGPAWRTYFSNGRWVDNFLCQGNSNTYAFNFAMIPYAMAARYLTLDPIRVAVEMDDMFDMNPNGDAAAGKRWSNGGVDSLLTQFASYGCRPAFDVNPLHAYEYMRGDNPTYERAWVGEAWSWPRKWRMSWVHHSHDSSAARPTSNLIGRFGGYTTGNGSGQFLPSSGHSMFTYHRARAFAWNPGNANPEQRYGIYQRLLYSDSLRRIVCPECIVPPYLSFPDNQVIPVNWRRRTIGTNWWSYRSVDGVDSLCTVDSTFLAIARGLRIPSGGTLYIRGTFSNGVGDTTVASDAGATGYRMRAWGYRSPKNTYYGSEGKMGADSVIAHTPFLYPGEERMVRDPLGASDVTGAGTPYRVRVKNIGCVTFDMNAANIQTVRGSSSSTLAKLLGFWPAVLDGSGSGPQDANGDYYRAAYSADPTGVYGRNGNEQKGWGRDHPRIVYFHPQNYAGSAGTQPVGAGKTYQTEQFINGILRPVRALNTIAGYAIVRWVYPWEVYAAR